jgi:hypothetical protein
MIDQKYILLILNCYKYKYKADKQIETWLKKLDNKNNNSNNNIIYFHVIGDVDKCKVNNDNADYFFDFHNKILYTKTKDDYLSLPHKVITALEAVNHTFNYDYVFKTDDDQELVDDGFFNKMMTTLSTKNYNYGGQLLNVKDHYSRYYTVHSELPKKLLLRRTSYCSGRFYFLSKAAVVNLVCKKERIKEHVIEDHAIGYYMDEHLKKNALHFLSDRFFRDAHISS